MKPHYTFAVITTPAPSLMKKASCRRAPVILPLRNYKMWLTPFTPLHKITALLSSFDDHNMNGYPLSPAITSPAANDKSLLRTTGPAIKTVTECHRSKKTKLTGIGKSTARSRRIKERNK